MTENKTVKTRKMFKTAGQLQCRMYNEKSQQITKNYLSKVIECPVVVTHNHNQ